MGKFRDEGEAFRFPLVDSPSSPVCFYEHVTHGSSETPTSFEIFSFSFSGHETVTALHLP